MTQDLAAISPNRLRLDVTRLYVAALKAGPNSPRGRAIQRDIAALEAEISRREAEDPFLAAYMSDVNAQEERQS